MDLAAVFLLSLLGGYCFAYIWRGSALTTKVMEGHHLYFRAALGGVILFSLALALRTTLIQNFPRYLKLDSALVEYVRPALKEEVGIALVQQIRRSEWVVTAIYSLLLGLLCGVLANCFTPRQWALRRNANDLYALLVHSRYKALTITLTLNTNEVYVGAVVATTDPSREPEFITLLPYFSGHRDTEGRLILTADYEALYAKLARGKASQVGLLAEHASLCDVTIRAADVVTATRFSPAFHTELNPNWKQQLAESSQQPQLIEPSGFTCARR